MDRNDAGTEGERRRTESCHGLRKYLRAGPSVLTHALKKKFLFLHLELAAQISRFFFFFFARTSINTIPAGNLENRGETGVLPESSTRT